jgi:hypothetical protein
MDKRFKEIYDNTIPHSSFLSERAILSCLYQSYQLGINDVFNWLSKSDYLTDKKDVLIKEFLDEKNNSTN